MNAEGTKLTIFVGADMVGKIIGKKGETIKSIQANSGARVDVNQNLPEGQPREARISASHHLFPPPLLAVRGAQGLLQLDAEMP